MYIAICHNFLRCIYLVFLIIILYKRNNGCDLGNNIMNVFFLWILVTAHF